MVGSDLDIEYTVPRSYAFAESCSQNSFQNDVFARLGIANRGEVLDPRLRKMKPIDFLNYGLIFKLGMHRFTANVTSNLAIRSLQP